MGESRKYLDDILRDPQGKSPDEIERLLMDHLMGTTAILLTQRGHLDAANLLSEVAEFGRIEQGTDWGVDYYEVVLDVAPQLAERFTEEIKTRILETVQEAVEGEPYGVAGLRIRPLLPRVEVNWREQVRAGGAPLGGNQARKVRLEPQHPVDDKLHFTNVWEHRVYIALKKQQAALDDNETIGIAPLPGVRVRERVFEPDFLVTYRGHAGIIEVDGPYHRGQASSDTSRDRQFLHAGVRIVDRLDVRDVNEEAQVDKFVIDFLRRLGA